MENNLVNVIGIIRTMDDLGRIVIPKEIRRVINIKEGDSLDIFAMTDGSILLRKVVDNKPVCGCPCSTAPAVKEKKVVHFVDNYNDVTKTVQITDAQDNLLNWLITNDYLSCDVDVKNGYPEVEDLT